MFRTTEQIYKENFNFKPMPKEEYYGVMRFGRNHLELEEYLKNKPERLEKIDEFKNRLYECFQTNFESIVIKYIKMKTNIKSSDYTYQPPRFCDNHKLIDDVKTVFGRIGRRTVAHNLFFEHVYGKTIKSNSGRVNTVIMSLNNVSSGVMDNNLASPSAIESDESIVMCLNTSLQKASVFNPMCWSVFIDAIRTKTDKLESILTPVGSWGSPAIAYVNSNLKEMVMIDVIPEVLEKSKQLFDYIEHSGLNSMFDASSRKLTTFCCPSQHIDKRHNFCDTYKNHFDAVFFSPAYYDVEMYEGGEQSWEEYKTYEEWLAGYWEGTVKMCYDSMRDDAVFSFVIVPDYVKKKKNKTINISHDMLEIAKKYFAFDETMHLSWGHTNRGKFGDDLMMEHVHFLKKQT